MDEETRKRVNAVIVKGLRGHNAGRRHPCEVTADRLGDALDRWPDAFDGEARDSVGYIRHILQAIADRERRA